VTLSDETERAIEACYDAALQPDRWPVALQLLGESLGADSCTFSTGERLSDPFRMPRSDGHEAFAERWIAYEPHAPDPHLTKAHKLRPSGAAFILEQDVTSDDERATGAYYTQIAIPADRPWWAGVGFEVAGAKWCLPLYRRAARGPFTVGEGTYAAIAAKHLARVVRLALQVNVSGISATLDVLESIRCAAVVLDTDGMATNLNDAARTLLGRGLTLHRGRMLALDRASNKRLQALIAASLTTAGTSAAHSPIIVQCEDNAGVVVAATPLTGHASSYFATGRSLLTLKPTSPPSLDLLDLKGLFGLTIAEARLAERMASGCDLGTAARAIGIGRETARTQIRNVFAKTGVRRQAELTALLAALPHGS
jgi:DNA-binding CsgD family transcriptional regulator